MCIRCVLLVVCVDVVLTVVMVVGVVASGSMLSMMCTCDVSSVLHVVCCAMCEKRRRACRCVGVDEEMGVCMKRGQSECSSVSICVSVVNAANTRV